MNDVTIGDDLGRPLESYSVTVTAISSPAQGDAQFAVHGPVGKRPLDAVTEIYKLYVGTVESNIERRLKLNQYYYSIVAAIVVAYAYLAEGRFNPPSEVKHLLGVPTPGSMATASPMLWPLPLLLLVISVAWAAQLRSMGRVSSIKFEEVYTIEQQLPVQPFTAEYRRREALTALFSGSRVEMLVPVALGAIALVALVLSLIPFALAVIRG